VPTWVAAPIPLARSWPRWRPALQLIGFGCTERGGGGAGVKRMLEKRCTPGWNLGWVSQATYPGDSGGALLSSPSGTALEVLGVLKSCSKMDSSCLFISGRLPAPEKLGFSGVPTPLVRDFVAPEEQSPKCNFEQLFSGYRGTGYDLFGDVAKHRVELEAVFARWQ